MSRRFNVVVGASFALAIAACGKNDTEPLVAGLHATSSPDTALVDARVQRRPEVVLVSDAGAPRSGATITFRVVAGGGTLADSVRTTDADGKATLGAWTLGPTATENVVEATADGGASVRFTALSRWPRRLATNAVGACAMPATTVFCWGDNTHAELAVPVLLASLTPISAAIAIVTPFPAQSQPAELFGTFGNHLCARSELNIAICWGRGTFGQLGRGTVGAESNLPNANVNGATWTQLSVGRITTCGIQGTARGFCWGSNQYGEVGANAQPRSLTARVVAPIAIDGGLQYRSLSAGWLYACGVTLAGEAWCWGNNQLGQLGIGAVDSLHIVPTRVATNERFVKIVAGNRFTCALTTDQRVFCWGDNRHGQLGDGTTTARAAPTLVAGGIKFTDIQVGSYFVTGVPAGSPALGTTDLPGHTCGLTEGGRAYCWGWNAWGQLGDATLTDRVVPTAVAGNLVFNGLSLGESMSCGMRGTSVWCWGANHFGQIGDGTATSRTTPVRALLP